MGKCIHHPDRETGYICMKHNIFFCDECIECRDPDLYCKFRPSCPVYFISKKGFQEPETEPVQKELAVILEPGHQTIRVPEGTNQLEAAEKSDMEEFTRAQFLPHTDANLFPSIKLTKDSQ